MGELPASDVFLLVRTDFSDDDAWLALRAVVGTETAGGVVATVEYVENPEFDGAVVDELVTMHPHRDSARDVMYVADQRALASDDFPLLVVRIGDPDDKPFRCRADTLHEVDVNLSSANLDWEDFFDQLGLSGVYGNDEPALETSGGASASARTPVGDAAETALRRIQADLEDPSGVIDDGVTVSVSGDVLGCLSDISDRFESPTWLTQGGYDVVDGYRLFAGDVEVPFWEVANLIVPRDGTIECAYTFDSRPDAVAAIWTWTRRPAGINPDKPAHRVDPKQLTPLLRPMTIRFRVEDGAVRADGQETTRVHVEHEDVPAGWQQDIRAYWRWILERADLDLDIGDVRDGN